LGERWQARFCDGCGGHGFHVCNHTGGFGDKKCDHCGGINHTEPYCWVKDGKPDYVHHIIDETTQSQPPFTSSVHVPSGSDSRDALTTQLSKLVQPLRTTLPSSSTATLTDSGNVACVAN
jgi:hypothetical protein